MQATHTPFIQEVIMSIETGDLVEFLSRKSEWEIAQVVGKGESGDFTVVRLGAYYECRVKVAEFVGPSRVRKLVPPLSEEAQAKLLKNLQEMIEIMDGLQRKIESAAAALR